MIGSRIIYNGELLELGAGVLGVDDPDLIHGWGCYETLKLREGRLYFPDLHTVRLLSSAGLLGIHADLSVKVIVEHLESLVQANRLRDANIKIILLGRDGRSADWYAFMQEALYPPAEAEREGVSCLLYSGERPVPRAKSLGLIVSALAFRAAQARQAWDALLVNRKNEITEGTRTNVFFFDPHKPGTLYTTPESDCLPGITKLTLNKALAAKRISVKERTLPLQEATAARFSLLVSSTSSILLPVRSLIDGDTNIALSLSPWSVELSDIYKSWLAEHEKA